MGGLLILGVLIAWFMAAKWLAGQATQRMTAGIPRLIAKVVLTAVFFIAPVIDEIIGAYQFEGLCETGGVYQIASEAGGKKFDFRFEASPYVLLSGYARPVSESVIKFSDSNSGDVIATAKTYVADGGWLVRAIGFSITSTSGPLIGRSQCSPSGSEEARRQKITNKLVN